MELSVLITISTIIAFIMAWFLLKVGLSLWIAMPITLAVALGITYFFSRGLTSPLRQMRDAAEAMAEGDYTIGMGNVIALTVDGNDVGSALQNAASIAAMVLTTESLVCDIPAPEPAAPAPGAGGMGGMY